MHLQCPRIPKLTQLQSRFAASLGGSLLILAIYFVLTSPRLAYAQELGSSGQAELVLPDAGSVSVKLGANVEAIVSHIWGRGPDIEPRNEDMQAMVEDLRIPPSSDVQNRVDAGTDGDQAGTVGHTHSTDPMEQQDLKKRQTGASPVTLAGNNQPIQTTIPASQVQRFVFSRTDLQGPSGASRIGLPGGFTDFSFQGTPPNEDEKHRGPAKSEIETRQSQKRVYVSINTCSQPQLELSDDTDDSAVPQLQLIVSSSSAQVGAANNPPADQIVRPLTEGFAAVDLNASGDVYIAVRAPSAPAGANGDWGYSLAVSIDGFYHQANFGLPPLYLVDTDTNSALLITDNLTQANASDEVYQQWVNLSPPPFTVFAQSNGTGSKIAGMRYSYCGLAASADLQASPGGSNEENAPVQMQMITRGLGNKPRQQIYVRGLNGSSTYSAILAMKGNSTAAGAGVVGGGGRVWTATNFTTKSDGNCALLFSLPFCSSTAYAVPSNPYTFQNTSALSTFYDNYARDLYTNFSLSLQLIPCNTSSTSQYSLSQNCSTCADAYKEWLCAVTIPRCEDYSAPGTYLQKRNVGQAFFTNESLLGDAELSQPYNPMPDAPTLSDASQVVLGGAMASNQSRNTRIDEFVRPGPYKELLPCEDLCFDLVRKCPSALGFSCPLAGRGLEVGYGKRDYGGLGVRCSFAGAVYQVAGAPATAASWGVWSLLLLAGTTAMAFPSMI